jgi:hypothetical protein
MFMGSTMNGWNLEQPAEIVNMEREMKNLFNNTLLVVEIFRNKGKQKVFNIQFEKVETAYNHNL